MKDQSNMMRITVAALSAAMLLSGCGQAPSDNAPEDAPEVEPTASIFGPEAKVPKPDEEAEIEPALPLKLTIGFPEGGTKLDADAVAALETALPTLKAEKAAAITLAAHSDAGGNDAANLDASQKRGLVVASWLVERGVSEDRIEVIAFGEQNPVQPNALSDGSPNELGRAANRRVEIVIASSEADAASAQLAED